MTIVWDMDGTIADFYGVEGWLEDLQNENPRPYIMAEPLWDMVVLTNLLKLLQSQGVRVVVTSWLAKSGSEEFKKVTRQAKLDWLNRYNFPYDEIHLVQYGTTKANCTRKIDGEQILIDDNEKVRNGWHLGATVNLIEEDVINFLSSLLN